MQIDSFWGAIETASVTYRGGYCFLDGDYFPLYTEIKAVWEVQIWNKLYTGHTAVTVF